MSAFADASPDWTDALMDASTGAIMHSVHHSNLKRLSIAWVAVLGVACSPSRTPGATQPTIEEPDVSTAQPFTTLPGTARLTTRPVALVPAEQADLITSVHFLPADNDVLIVVSAQNTTTRELKETGVRALEYFENGTWHVMGLLTDAGLGYRLCVDTGSEQCSQYPMERTFAPTTTSRYWATASSLPPGRYRASLYWDNPDFKQASPEFEFDGQPRPPTDLTNFSIPGATAPPDSADIVTTVSVYTAEFSASFDLRSTGEFALPEYIVIQRRVGSSWTNVAYLPLERKPSGGGLNATRTQLSSLTPGTYRGVLPVNPARGLTQASPEVVLE
jgi:hypothetical protein